MEKQIRGIVSGYSQIQVKEKEGKQFTYVDMYMQNTDYSYKFFFDTAEEAKEKLIDKVPIGSTVSFKIFQKGKYWNVLKDTFKVIYEGDGSLKERDPRKDVLIVRQNALAHADEWLRFFTSQGDVEDFDKVEEEYFRFAEKCEEWILRRD